jgi:hypothetical protein
MFAPRTAQKAPFHGNFVVGNIPAGIALGADDFHIRKAPHMSMARPWKCIKTNHSCHLNVYKKIKIDPTFMP